MVKKQQHGGEQTSFVSGLWGNTNNTQSNNSGWFGSDNSSSGLFGSNTSGSLTVDSSNKTISSGLTFQKIVSYIAAIILAATLAVIGFMVYNSQSTLEYPPEVSECPDYWESTGPNKCRNTLKVGKCTDTDEMDFNEPKYSGPTGLAEKCKWANSCGLVWDGLKC
jgi:hypothetical protein